MGSNCSLKQMELNGTVVVHFLTKRPPAEIKRIRNLWRKERFVLWIWKIWQSFVGKEWLIIREWVIFIQKGKNKEFISFAR